MSVEVDLPSGEALTRTRAALATQGLGVLTEIDVAATLAGQARGGGAPAGHPGRLQPGAGLPVDGAEPDVGLLLPCNAVVRGDEDGVTRISALDPDVMVALAGQAALGPVAVEAQDRLASALGEVADGAPAGTGAGDGTKVLPGS